MWFKEAITVRLASLRRIRKCNPPQDKRVNIRMTEKDLVHFQKKAVEEGLPYQTLISSILHKYVNGRLVEGLP